MKEKAIKHILDEIFEGTAYIYAEVFEGSLSPEEAKEELDNLKDLCLNLLLGVIKNGDKSPKIFKEQSKRTQ